MNSHNNPKRRELEEGLLDELCDLVGLTCDGLLSEPQRARLNEMLAESPKLRAQYLQYIALHSALTTTAGNQAAQGIEEFGRQLVSQVTLPISQLRLPKISRPSNALLRAALVGFALISAAIYSVSFWSADQVGSFSEQAAVKLDLPTTDLTAIPAAQTQQFTQVAYVDNVSANARWINPNESYTVHSIIRAGNKLSLAQGEIELLYETGVKLLLIGPVDFVMHERGGELSRGGLMASVPKAGHGFKIETPNGTVIDLGTKFGVIVDDFGVSEVSVFEGKVEAFPSSTAGTLDGKYELPQGRALQWSDEILKPLKADARRLPFSLASFSRESIDDLPENVVQSNSLATDPVDPQQWKALGDVRPQSSGFILEGQRTRDGQPYLISSTEFDPTNGPVTIVCDVRFPQFALGDEPSFSILTRSEDERTEMNRPWRDVLATCLRCNFRAATDKLDGLLETATKYERDRELTGISWGGFVRPEADVPYRLVMRDDGVNISFTVSQVDNPSVSKTVTCRSLFRGYKNYVALEGWDAGRTIVESVRVYQETPVGSLANHFPNLREVEDESLTANVTNDSAESYHALIDLVPTHAELIIRDSFDEEKLNPQLWKTLGDVVQTQGAVSLGNPDTLQHIDTFHPRPYLLTRRQFTPADGKLYILGTIEFDENYLQGYGGSFAVMTRSDDRYGVGPEWAVSALSTGVRSNFWPAAPRKDHILEIHEKLAPETLTFLSGANLEIDPQSRSYRFCMEDDGHTVALTIQDTAQHAIHKSFHHKTLPEGLKSGFIAFESCWGSRVLLDDVRIYVERSEASSEAK